jgi:hypothetical protein
MVLTIPGQNEQEFLRNKIRTNPLKSGGFSFPYGTYENCLLYIL